MIAAQGPVATGSADQGDNNPPGTNTNTGDQTPGGTDNGNDDGNDQIPVALTTICAEKTASGFWEKTKTYTWTVDKEVSESEDVLAAADCDGYDIQIEPGECAVISYTISADRSEPCESEAYGVRGEVKVTNTGCNPTVDLAICGTIQVMYCEGGFVDYLSYEVDTSCHPVLAAGESYCYAYEVEFTPAEGAIEYRNVADVTICNFVDHAGEAYGVEACAGFSIPCVPTCIVIDDKACLRDDFTVPCGFVVEALSEVGPWELCDDAVFCVNLKITNVDAPRNTVYELCNQAVLVPEDSRAAISDHEPVNIYSGIFEATLCVEKTAQGTWNEDIELEMVLPDGWATNNVDAGAAESVVDVMPDEMAKCIIRDDGTFNVWGSIKVTNTGCYATEGLTIIDTIQVRNGKCWENATTFCVDVSCMPVLQPGESYCYPYAVTFTLENVSKMMLTSCDFVNVAYAQICNYDDDAPSVNMGVYAEQPIDMATKPCVLTMKTEAVYSSDEVKALDHTGQDSVLCFETDVCYEQMVVVHYGDERVTVDSWTNVTAHTKVTHSCWHENVCKDLDTAIYHYECSTIVGNDNKATVAFESTSYDNESMTICILCYPVELNMCAVLYDCSYLAVHSNYCGYMFDDKQMLFYGVFASFEWPEEAFPEFLTEA